MKEPEPDRDPVGVQERKERRDISGVDDEKSLVMFAIDPVSPYAYPLDGERYTPESRFGPTGLCPICNNAQHRQMDNFFVKNLGDRISWKRYGFAEEDVVRHLVNHIGPVYTRTGRELLSAFAARSDVEALDPAFLARIHRASQKEITAGKREESFKPFDEKWGDSLIIAPADETEYTERAIEPSFSGRTIGAKAKQWYAFDGENQTGQLRPWGDKRMANEVEKRADDSIVFYDEMLMVRKMGLDIYHEIMDKDNGEPIMGKDGELLGYKDKNYGSALNAAKLIKDVAMDMAKLAIIGVKLEGNGEQMRQLSPTMQAMIDDLGILAKRDLPSGETTPTTAVEVVDDGLDGPDLFEAAEDDGLDGPSDDDYVDEDQE